MLYRRKSPLHRKPWFGIDLRDANVSQVRQSVTSDAGFFVCRSQTKYSGEKSHGHRSANHCQSLNAQKSTGPTTEAGKAKSSANAFKTGLTGRIMMHSGEDVAVYEKHLTRFFTKYTPVNDDEHELVQTIADDKWRLLRIAPVEAAIYADGRDKLAHLVAGETDPVKRDGLLLGHIYLTYKKDLGNIAIQEQRLRKQIEKTAGQLEAMQKGRTEGRHKEVICAKRSLENCEKHNVEPDFSQFGFDFSVPEFETFLVRSHAYNTLSGGHILNFDKFLAEFRLEEKAEAK